jgi:hypothetical protein
MSVRTFRVGDYSEAFRVPVPPVRTIVLTQILHESKLTPLREQWRQLAGG